MACAAALSFARPAWYHYKDPMPHLKPPPPLGPSLGHRLLNACRSGSTAAVRRLLDLPNGYDLLSTVEDGTLMTPLAVAVELGDLEIAEMLLDHGADEHGISRDVDGNTILAIAAKHGRANLLELYHCYHDSVLDHQNHDGFTPLLIAAKAGDEATVRTLLDLGADIDLPDLRGDTPLHYASSYGHRAVIRLLIERGAGFAIKNERGWSASDYAYSLSTQKFFQEISQQVLEQNKRERSRRNAAKHAAKVAAAASSAAGSERSSPQLGHQRVGSDASAQALPVFAPSEAIRVELHPNASNVPAPQAIKQMPSSSTLLSSGSVGTYGTSGVSSNGPLTPPYTIDHRLPPPVVSTGLPRTKAEMVTPTSPNFGDKLVVSPGRAVSPRSGSSSSLSASPHRPAPKSPPSGESAPSPLRNRQGSNEPSRPPAVSMPQPVFSPSSGRSR